MDTRQAKGYKSFKSLNQSDFPKAGAATQEKTGNGGGREGRDGRDRPRGRPHGKYLWAIYPDYWKKSWGQRPLLGYVTADEEFYAERAAYDKGLLSVNYTFRPHCVNLGLANSQDRNSERNSERGPGTQQTKA